MTGPFATYVAAKCTCCKKQLRTGSTTKNLAGYLLDDVLTLTAHIHHGQTETRRYCAECGLILRDGLLEKFGFVFETRQK